MSTLSIDKKSVKDLLNSEKSLFLIPDYQRRYSWDEEKCQTLWDDLCSFALPDDDFNKFNNRDVYFLGCIVTFCNQDGLLEVIDGQQRLTTLTLLLRALYERFSQMQDDQSVEIRRTIQSCLWSTNLLGDIHDRKPRVVSQAAFDADRTEFEKILADGRAEDSWKSAYAVNYRFFQKLLQDLVDTRPSFLAPLTVRVLLNVILLPIETESQDSALQIFSTLNDRGMPLSDADIFKSQLYRFYQTLRQEKDFAERWKRLDKLAQSAVAGPRITSPMNELFLRCMYWMLASSHSLSSSVPGLRDFYAQNKYRILKDEKVLPRLEALADFWDKVQRLDPELFPVESVRKRLYVLRYAPNNLWTQLLSVWILARGFRMEKPDLKELDLLLRQVTAYLLGRAVMGWYVTSMRPDIFRAMISIVDGKNVSFDRDKIVRAELSERLRNFEFSNGKSVTRFVLAWWALHREDQSIPDLSQTMWIEHIYARQRNKFEPLNDQRLLESLGNKSFLENGLNISVSDYRFTDKRRWYLGQVSGKKETVFRELKDLAVRKADFREEDILERQEIIFRELQNELSACGLLADEPA